MSLEPALIEVASKCTHLHDTLPELFTEVAVDQGICSRRCCTHPLGYGHDDSIHNVPTRKRRLNPDHHSHAMKCSHPLRKPIWPEVMLINITPGLRRSILNSYSVHVFDTHSRQDRLQLHSGYITKVRSTPLGCLSLQYIRKQSIQLSYDDLLPP